MTTSTPRPPDPTGARTTADFVQALVGLRQWAGEPSLSRLRSLGGQTVIPDGTAIDALPKSTISHVLRQTGKVPRWDFVKAFVTACLQYSDYPADLIPAELERWRAARTALAEPSTRPVAPPDAPADHAEAPETAEAETLAAETAEAPAAVAVPEAVKTWIMAQVEASDRPHADQALELLARRVAGEADRARKGLLGGYNIAPVSFGPHADPLLPGEDGEVIDDLRSIGRFFSGLRPRRLLVVGESGAGKTVLAIELVLQLMETFTAGGAPSGGRPMVPVRLDAARWTLGSPFEPWVAGQLTQEYGLSAEDADRLVRDRQVLPVVDGLDELDPAPSSGLPRRAIGLLAELNRYSDLSGRHAGAVVVTCRADRYAELAEVRAGLEDAARIHLHSLTAEQIGAYLHARWPEGHPCGEHRDRIVAMLSGPAAVHLALSTPWRLLLTVTAVESGADPAELLHADPDCDPGKAAARITRRLLDAYVPAATDLTPRGARRSQGGGTRAPYRPEQVRTWLVHLAAHLRWQAVHAIEIDRPPPGLTAIDVVPHLLWPIGGRRRVRVLHGLCCAAFAIVAMLAFWTGSAVDPPDGPSAGIGLAEGFTLALMAGWVAIAIGLALSPWPSAAGGRANVPRRQRVIGGLLGGLVGAPAGALGGLGGLWLTGGKVFGFGFALIGGSIGGFVLGAVIGVTAAGRRGAERMTVIEAIRAEPASLMGFGLCGALTGLPPLRLAGAGPVAFTLVVTGAFGAAFALGIAFKIATGGWSTDAELAHPREALHRNPTIGLAFGLTGGVAAFLVFVMNQDFLVSVLCALTGGVTFGLAFGAIAWSRTMIGLVVAASRGLLPLRLWTFLDWACEARLLRVSGATYQFRHRELQDFLTPEPADPRR
ncbi:NACHT domain-containing protein [Actinomadura sp. 6N118]|uniref:NACHT domain-containing protein n=1 Tax=Actinomadura sp. 6N118 TaxID=3375151 RepID=UPI00379BED37